MRFVLLSHTGWPGRPDHLDLLLQAAPGRGEDDRVLRAFASRETVLPSLCQGVAPADLPIPLPRSWRPLPDHRRAYLRHEGPVGEGRGTVARVDEGEWELLVEEAQPRHVLRFRLHGRRVTGDFQLAGNPDGRYTLTLDEGAKGKGEGNGRRAT